MAINLSINEFINFFNYCEKDFLLSNRFSCDCANQGFISPKHIVLHIHLLCHRTVNSIRYEVARLSLLELIERYIS